MDVEQLQEKRNEKEQRLEVDLSDALEVVEYSIAGIQKYRTNFPAWALPTKWHWSHSNMPKHRVIKFRRSVHLFPRISVSIRNIKQLRGATRKTRTKNLLRKNE